MPPVETRARHSRRERRDGRSRWWSPYAKQEVGGWRQERGPAIALSQTPPHATDSNPAAAATTAEASWPASARAGHVRGPTGPAPGAGRAGHPPCGKVRFEIADLAAVDHHGRFRCASPPASPVARCERKSHVVLEPDLAGPTGQASRPCPRPGRPASRTSTHRGPNRQLRRPSPPCHHRTDRAIITGPHAIPAANVAESPWFLHRERRSTSVVVSRSGCGRNAGVPRSYACPGAGAAARDRHRTETGSLMIRCS